jgi:DNA-binding HxlR family transcriptional regulator
MVKSNFKTERPSEAQCKATLNSVADALYVIGGKWKLRIIVALKEGTKRFNEMQRLIDGISAKVLSTELKDLELNGFVRRNVFTGSPVVVEYELTDYAETL